MIKHNYTLFKNVEKFTKVYDNLERLDKLQNNLAIGNSLVNSEKNIRKIRQNFDKFQNSKNIEQIERLVSDTSKIRQPSYVPSLSHIISIHNNLLSHSYFPFDDRYRQRINNYLNSFPLNNWYSIQKAELPMSVVQSNHSHFLNNILNGNKKSMLNINTPALIKPYTIPNTKLFTVMYSNYIDVINSFNLKTKAFKCINKLQEYDWMFPIEKLSDEEFMNQIINLSENEIESFMLNYYQKNEFQMIKKNLKEIMNNMDSLDDYRKQGNINNLLFVLNTFSKDPSNFTPHFSNLLGIIEYLNLIGNDFKAFRNTKECNNPKAINRKYFKYENIHLQNHFKSNDKRIINKYYLLSYNAYPIALDLYENFDENDGEKLNRNTIQHGKADFEEFSIKDFITLIALCNAFSVLASYK